MSLMEVISLVAVVFAGGLTALYVSGFKQSYWPKLILSFGGAYLLGLTFVELLPVVYESSTNKVGIWILVGFLIQIMLERLSQGVEHGHIHHHENRHSGYYYSMMIGLCLHAFLEGFPLGAEHLLESQGHNHAYLLGILIHKFPAAFALVSILFLAKFSRPKLFLFLGTFSLMTPLGLLLSSAIQLSPAVQQIILAVVIGLFLHISTTILFEVEESVAHHRLSWYKLAAILIGFVVAYLM